MLNKLIFYFLFDLRNRYNNRFLALLNAISITVNLVIYWFTSKAFAPSMGQYLDSRGMDYFTFLLIGELGLLIPLGLQDGLSSYVKFLGSEGVLENMMVYPGDLKNKVLKMYMGNVFVALFQMFVTIILSYLYFGWSLSPKQLLFFIGWIIFITPMFYQISIIALAYTLYFGKAGITFALSTFASVIAGSYFPITVLPEWLQKVSIYLSPLTPTLQGLRHLLFDGVDSEVFLRSLKFIMIWTIILTPIAHYFYKWSMKKFREKGCPLIPTV